ncbi:MAG: ribosome maturation factor [Chitinophagaceae bacterium]|nr:ribosome maturation factor [Chitinophagaceae bacterium]
MSIEKKTETIRNLAEEMITGEPGHFLVDVKLKPGNNIQVLLDADAGLPLSKCVSYNRSLYKTIEEAGLFAPGDFALEVSSPGLDEPLKLPRQYRKNIGRAVEIILKDGRKFSGKLLSAESDILIEETKGKGKKQETVQHTFSTDQIKTTKIQIVI